MWRTGLLSTIIVIATYILGDWLTHDFQIWTAEGARRLAVAQNPVPTPELVVQGPAIQAVSLPTLLTQSGTVTVVDFVYTRCATVCQTLGTSFQQLQAAIQARGQQTPAVAGRLQLLSISFDPMYDTQAVLSAYSARLKANGQFWQFVSTSDAHSLKRLLKQFQVVVIPDGMGGYEHNAALLVIDQRGRLVRVFDYDEVDAAFAFAQRLSIQPVVGQGAG